jgi:hypoxanthine phosphoribosyltransferase
MIGLQAITFGDQKYVYLSAEKSHQLAFTLASLINEKISQGEVEKPEIIVGIARGAISWLKTLSDWLNIDQMASLRIVHYADVGKMFPKPRILESYLPPIDKKRVLLFDNVVETGKTMKLAINYLSMCGATKITTSVIFRKKTSTLIPDFYAKLIDAWIIFYFDVLESVKCLGVRWVEEGLKPKLIKKRFLKIGIPSPEVNYAMKIIFNFS